MRFLTIAFALISLFTILACREGVNVDEGAHVGLVRLNLKDPIRKNWAGTEARPLVTSMWYPAAKDAQMLEIGIPPNRPVFIGGYAARNAEFLKENEKRPLIIMSHGTGGAGMQMMWLGRELAANGYIVAAVDHHGNTAAEDAFDPRGFRMPWERAKDISAVLDFLLADAKWGPRIDGNKIGAVGFSLGGYTVTALAGGQLDFDQFENFCKSNVRDATCEEQSEYPEAGAEFDDLVRTNPDLAARMKEHRVSYRDTRLGAIVALAPALTQALTAESMEDIQLPFLTLVGEIDQVAPAETNAKRLTEIIPAARLHLLPGADHYTFLNDCNRRGRRFVPLCKEVKGTTRRQVHAQATELTINFFNESLDY